MAARGKAGSVARVGPLQKGSLFCWRMRFRREGGTVRKIALHAVLAVFLVLALSLVAGAQGPPPRGEFGRHGPGGPGGPGGPMGGSGSCATPCTPYQFTVTITSTEPVLVNGAASTITNTTTGTNLVRGRLKETRKNLSLSRTSTRRS